jgi:hypothetical protein
MITITRDWIRAVRELMERNLDALEIAHRLNLDPQDVMAIIKVITDVVS